MVVSLDVKAAPRCRGGPTGRFITVASLRAGGTVGGGRMSELGKTGGTAKPGEGRSQYCLGGD